MFGFEAEGAAAIVKNQVITHPETVATAIRIGNPASWKTAVAAAEESQGLIDAVSDEEILEAYRLLAREEGLFAEPASCASLAGVKKQLDQGRIKPGSRIVCVLTGNGLKDPNTAIEAVEVKPTVLDNDYQQLVSKLKEGAGV